MISNVLSLAQWPWPKVREHLAGEGLDLDLGLVRARVRARTATLCSPLATVYGHFTPATDGLAWADIQATLVPAPAPRHWLRPQVRFLSDAVEPFDPFPASHALPLLEWGLNWLIARQMNDVLLLHAGVLEKAGRALVMPALPGSGKSTLTAALSLRGWRLLSDEFGAYDPATGAFRAVLKPVALKNESIEVIRAFAPGAEIGPEFPKTRKGTVAHLAPGADAVARLHEPALPGAAVFPRWERGSATRLMPITQRLAFTTLAFNAFNYTALGAVGFSAAVHLVRAMPAWQLIYSDLDDAIARLDALWPEVCAGGLAPGLASAVVEGA